jgi:hypothetical protein
MDIYIRIFKWLDDHKVEHKVLNETERQDDYFQKKKNDILEKLKLQ